MNRFVFPILLSMAAALPALPVMAQESANNDAGWAAVTAAAKKEGSLVLYSSEMGTACLDSRIKDYEDRYGIKVSLVNGRITELEQRISVEQATHRPIADIYSTAVGGVHRGEANGWLQPHGVISNAAHVAPAYRDDDDTIDYEAIVYGVLANTDATPADQLPKSWHDLLDPKWKGKILADDLTINGTGLLTFTSIYHTPALGRDYLAALARQDMTISRQQGQDVQRIALAEFPLYFPIQSTYIPGMAGLPLKMLFMEEGVPFTRQALGILKDAAHVNAAKLFMNHYLDPKWQAACAQGGATRPAIEGTPVGSSPIEQQVANAKLIGSGDINPKEQDELTRAALSIFKPTTK